MASAISWAPRGSPPAFETYAYNVVLWSCANANLTMAHEIGHNMGLHHDRSNVLPTRVLLRLGLRRAGRGARRHGLRVRRAALPQAADLLHATRQLSRLSLAAGTATEDNARALNDTSLIVANFRQSLCTYALTSTSATAGPAGAVGQCWGRGGFRLRLDDDQRQSIVADGHQRDERYRQRDRDLSRWRRTAARQELER